MKRNVLSTLTIIFAVMSLALSAYAHSGRTDSSGGHKDNKNKSGLGYYHYHCGGYPPHLHTNGVCPYKGGGTSSKSSSGSFSYSVPKTVYATKVNVPNMPSSVYIGESVNLEGSVYPSSAEDKEITWESSDDSVATVDSEGNLEAVGIGTAIISAKTSRGTTSKFTLTVNEILAKSIAIQGKLEEIKIGKTADLSVIFMPENTTYKTIEWKSDDEDIVSVDKNGNINALSVGKTVITAIHKELTDSFEIEVKPIFAESIKINCINEETGKEYEELRFKKGEELQLYADVFPEDTTDTTVKWSVSDPEIATVDKTGKLVFQSEGVVTVTAETSNGIIDKVNIEVYSVVVPIVITVVICIIGGTIFLIIWSRKKQNI